MVGNKLKVVDASFILSYLLPDETLSQVEEIFSKYETGELEFIATKILPFEVFNGLCTATNFKKRISKAQLKELGDIFLRLSIKLVDIDFTAVAETSVSKNLTFYDACYYYIAKVKKLPLLTFDKALSKLV